MPGYDPNWVSSFEPESYDDLGTPSRLGRGLRMVEHSTVPASGSRIRGPVLGEFRPRQEDPTLAPVRNFEQFPFQQNSQTNTTSPVDRISNPWQRFLTNPRDVKENILAEHMARMENNYGSNWAARSNVNNSARVARDVITEGINQGFDPRGAWRRVSHEDLITGGTAQQEAAMFFDEKADRLAGSNLKQQALSKLKDYVGQFKPGNVRDYVPSFIANPLALRNPLVSPDSSIAQGSQFNPELVDWMSKQTGSPFDKQLNALGGRVSASSYYPNSGDPKFNIAFEGPAGYFTHGDLKKGLKELNQNIAEGTEVELSQKGIQNVNKLLKRTEENPHASDAIKYQLGRVIEQVPTGGTITATPLEGSGGARDVLYKRLSRGALETGKPFKPNLDQYPTEEEFRAASSGGGLNAREINANANIIKSVKTGPAQFKTITGKNVTWNPSELKDPMIKSAFGIDPGADVSGLRDNPMSAFLNKGKIDFSRPVITTDSPVYKLRQGIKGGAGLAATTLIPSPEAIRSFYAGDTAAGVGRMAGDIASGIPVAAAAGGIATLAPATAPFIGAAGPAFAGIAAVRALNEVSRQQAGEGLVPKFRQFIGTAPRTGIANAAVKSKEYTQPRLIKTAQPNPIFSGGLVSSPVVREIQNRMGLAGARFNPARGEFGLSELLFGR